MTNVGDDYEICHLLAPKLKHLTPPLKQEKRRMVKQNAGELGHLDCHHLSTAVTIQYSFLVRQSRNMMVVLPCNRLVGSILSLIFP